jgi:hypothetical protein
MPANAWSIMTRESGRLRLAPHSGKEAVKVFAALGRPRWRSEEEDEEQCAERTLHHRPSFTIPFVRAQAGIRGGHRVKALRFAANVAKRPEVVRKADRGFSSRSSA